MGYIQANTISFYVKDLSTQGFWWGGGGREGVEPIPLRY